MRMATQDQAGGTEKESNGLRTGEDLLNWEIIGFTWSRCGMDSRQAFNCRCEGNGAQ